VTEAVKSVCVPCVGIFRTKTFTAECDVPCMCNVISNNNMSA